MSTANARRGCLSAMASIGGFIALLLIGILARLGVIKPPPSGTLVTVPPIGNITPTVTPASNAPWLSILFTNPVPADAIGKSIIEQVVIPDINRATRSIDFATFDLNLPVLIDALVQAEKRGVQVRGVVDMVEGSTTLSGSRTPDGQDLNSVTVLRRNGVNLVDGGRVGSLMHNKFILIDSTVLYMGSWNLSYNDTYRNNNNILRITAQRVISDYQYYFDQMFNDHRFGATGGIKAPNPQMNLDGVPVEIYFAPTDRVIAKIIPLVGAAQHSIKFMAFSFTHPILEAQMLSRARAGVQIDGLFELRNAAGTGSAMPLFFCAQLPTLRVRMDANRYTMHHKVIIIDDQIVITGSFNFSDQADTRNDENIIIIHSQAIAQQYLREFDKLYNDSSQPYLFTVTC